MLKKYFLVMLVGLATMALPAFSKVSTTYAQQGQENFIFVNYIGQEMTFDLDDVTYIIPGTDTMPEGGRLTLQLTPGPHKYAANIPGVGLGSAGEFTITPGAVIAKAARIEQTGPTVDNEGILLEKPRDFVKVFDFDPFAGPVETSPVADTWQPAMTTPGDAGLVWINYIGDELTVDLNGQLYKVPPPTQDIPGRLQIEVAPGDYRYTVSVPNGSLNGQITAIAGQIVGLNIFADPPPEREYIIGEKYEFVLPVEMNLFEEDLTGQAQAAATTAPTTSDSAPATLPVTGGEINPVIIDSPPSPGGLLIKNYAGDTLIFTINNQAHSIPNNTQQTLSLPLGHYTYTASTPFVATTGEVVVQADRGLELSIVINVAHDFLAVYQN